MKKIQTTWNLSLLYKSATDPAINRDVKLIEDSCAEFAKKWDSNQSYIKNEKILNNVLLEYKKLMHIIGDAKPVSYFMLARDIDSASTFLSAQISKVQERITVATNDILFFEISLGNITPALRVKILKNPFFKEFHYFLEKIWKSAVHQLSNSEEKIMALKSEPAYQLWLAANEKLVDEQEVLWKGSLIPIHQATGIMSSLTTINRRKLHALICNKLKSISFLATAELNAVVINKKIDDTLRSFEKPYSATVLDYENDEVAIDAMIRLIDSHQKYSHEFYKIKAELLELDHLEYSDVAVTVAAKKVSISFEKGAEIVSRALGKVDVRYKQIFEEFLYNGQIDVYARVGKRGGGYCWGGYNRPTYILLNWTDDFHSVMTLAHEMGHAIHREFSKSQNVMYEAHPISTAEVASTLFENFVFEELVSELSPRDLLLVEVNRVQDSIATIFRQAAYFEFELEMHKMIRKDGQISSSDLARLMQQSLKKHLGKIFHITEDDGYLFVRYSHARWFFYVYSYAYGNLISNVLYAHYRNDSGFVEKINQFLSSGGSASPEEIFASIGINTADESFWKQGLDEIGMKISKLKKDLKRNR